MWNCKTKTKKVSFQKSQKLLGVLAANIARWVITSKKAAYIISTGSPLMRGTPPQEGGSPSKGGLSPSWGGPGAHLKTSSLKRVLFTLHHDLQKKEPKLQKATMMCMIVWVWRFMCLLSMHQFIEISICVGKYNKFKHFDVERPVKVCAPTGLPVHRRRNYRRYRATYGARSRE